MHIFIETNLDWQYPALTEKQAFNNHIDIKDDEENIYLAFPWATLIDNLTHSKEGINLKSYRELIIEKTEKFKDKKIHTVCQHISWRYIENLWKEIGVSDVHLSHCEKNNRSDKFNFHSWPLIATNYENLDRREGLIIKNNKDKKYITSFIGSNSKQYRSDIRLKLKEYLEGFDRTLYELKERWFYHKIVYGKQIKKEELEESYLEEYKKNTKRYNEILSDTIFSLCPEGTGPNTLRLWESMSIGSIPVIFSDEWQPPIIKEFNWEDIAVLIKREKSINTLEILKSYNNEKIEFMKNNCLLAYDKFSKMRCFA
jgi:hypothetical protein